MGVWGAGLFENDAALDYVAGFVNHRMKDLDNSLKKLHRTQAVYISANTLLILHILQLIDRKIEYMLHDHVESLESLQYRFSHGYTTVHPESAKITIEAFNAVVRLANEYHHPDDFHEIERESDIDFRRRQTQIIAMSTQLDLHVYVWRLIKDLKEDVQSCLYDLRPQVWYSYDCGTNVVLPASYIITILIENLGLASWVQSSFNAKHARLWKQDYLEFLERLGKSTREESAEEMEFSRTRKKVIHDTFDKLIATLEKQP